MVTACVGFKFGFSYKFVVNLSGGKSHFVFLIILINLVLLIEKVNGFF